MIKKFVNFLLLTLALCFTISLNANEEIAKPQTVKETSTSLKFYGNLTKEELKDRMKYISNALGVKCNYCHLKDKSISLSDQITNPRERKILERKNTALEMIRMVEHINSNFLNWKHGSGRKADQVDCYVCHRGEPEHLVKDIY